jgi:cyanophycinase
MRYTLKLISILLAILLAGCNQQESFSETQIEDVRGKLFIIGGGKRPADLVARMIKEAGVDTSGYTLVLPMASSQEDTAIYYSSKQFTDQGVDSVFALRTKDIIENPEKAAEWVRNASLIYISGGAQDRFMDAVLETPVETALHEAFSNGALIAGTSAGAAVMSSKMITGNEFKHPVYTGDFPTIEANNIELKKGLGFLEHVIIDQHFVKRQRLNRLIAVSLENPEKTCVGIDESTALLVKPGSAEVVGESQVLVIRHREAETKIVNGLLGGKNMELSVYLPGDTLDI